MLAPTSWTASSSFQRSSRSNWRQASLWQNSRTNRRAAGRCPSCERISMRWNGLAMSGSLSVGSDQGNEFSIGTRKWELFHVLKTNPPKIHRSPQVHPALFGSAAKYVHYNPEMGVGMPNAGNLFLGFHQEVDFFLDFPDAGRVNGASPFLILPPGNSHSPPSKPSGLRRVMRIPLGSFPDHAHGDVIFRDWCFFNAFGVLVYGIGFERKAFGPIGQWEQSGF
jgi:hypothetical protein